MKGDDASFRVSKSRHKSLGANRCLANEYFSTGDFDP